ncbi:MAG: TetR/AcrR family transcriptional regulator [Deltaproteobacteria bacterium]|nr:TetR/AcrR family transcriptional regulator [Deltaproteobacteria bacterium]
MDRKEDILLKARRKFSRYGYTKTTMDDIARDCEITKPTLYHYYAGKADLFAAVIEHEQNAFFKLVEEATADVASTAEKLRIYLDMQIKSLQEFLVLGELSRHAFLDLHPDSVKVLTTCRVREENLLSRWIADGVRAGEFTVIDCNRTAHIFFMTFAALRFEGLFLNNPTDDEITDDEAIIGTLSEEFRSFVDLFLQGLRTRRDIK